MEKSKWLKDGERIDDLQCGGYELIQRPERFCFGVDAVLLAHYARIKEGDNVLDLGTGTGVIPILQCARSKRASFVGLEIQRESADMAMRSVSMNGLDDRIRIVHGDIKEAASLFDAASFQVVTSNPPYMIKEDGLINSTEPKTIARHEVLCTLEDVVSAASCMLKQTGRFYLIHKPFRLPEILAVMQKYHIEPKELRMVHPYVDKEPSMVLIGGVKGGRPRMKVAPPLILYRDKQVYSDEVYEMYKGSKG